MQIIKRTGVRANFDPNKITEALNKCFCALGDPKPNLAERITIEVSHRIGEDWPRKLWAIAEIQNAVERELLAHDEVDAAHAYITYKTEHAIARGRDIPESVRQAFDTSAPYFPTALQGFQFYDKYARWDDAKGRRETWVETVDRVMAQLDRLVHQQTRDPNGYTQSLRSEGTWLRTRVDVREGILQQKVMPSMRMLAMAGPAVERNNASAYNCFSGAEEYMTPSGPKRFVDTVGTYQTVRAIDGEWRAAQVACFGEQEVYDVTLKHHVGRYAGRAGNETWVIRATENHRWILFDGSSTMGLKVGDKLSPTSVSATPTESLPNEAIRHGIFFGDGTISDGRAQIRLCGAKAGYADEYFGEFNRSYPPSYKGDPVVYCGGNTHWKKVPVETERFYVEGFLHGLFLADGAKRTCPNRQISTQDKELVTWIRRYAPLAGYKVVSDRVVTGPTNYGERSAPLHTFTLARGERAAFRVVNIKKVGVEPVYCVMEPITNTFTLANGQITGNCCYTGVDSPQSIVEILTLLMCGCGVGFSVERRFVDKLPPVDKGSHWKQDLYMHAGKPVIVTEYDYDPTARTTHVVEDSSEGWAAAVQCGLLHWWAGNDHMEFDYSKIRAAGTPLRTKGGTASGPGPLRTMLANIRSLVLAARGRHLLPIEVHDMVCMVADCVVSGGVRRSATISLFDWEDRDMWEAKSGNWFETAPWRANANNSVVWPDRDLTQVEVMDFVLQMVKSGYGEPGIFSRRAALATMPARRLAQWTEEDRKTFGINPCGEVLLKNRGFCNLSICVARAGDTTMDLAKKVDLATVIGTIQSCATMFKGLSAVWTENAEQERLLGVDITGQADRPFTESEMDSLKEIVHHTNCAWAGILGINESAATTVVKPSGNSSVLLNCSPGINPRWSRWQIRNVRVGAATPMYRVLREAGVPMDPENGQDPATANRWVAHFPVAAPEGALTTRDVTALGQCEIWKRNKLHWTEHNPSTTVTFRPDEVLDICKWLYDNQRIVGGMAFLPASDHKYAQAPNEELTEVEYIAAVAAFPQVDFALLYAYEQHDETTSTKELACMGGVCMLE